MLGIQNGLGSKMPGGLALITAVLALSGVLIIFSGIISQTARLILYLGCTILIVVFWIKSKEIDITWNFVVVLSAYILFSGLAIFSLLWTPSDIYASFKINRIISVNIFLLILGSVLAMNRFSLIQYFWFFYLLAVIYALISLITPFFGMEVWEPFGYANHISLGRVLGLGIIIGVVLFIQSKQNTWKHFVLVSILFFALINAGTRQALLAIIVVMGLLGIQSIFKRQNVSITTLHIFSIILAGISSSLIFTWQLVQRGTPGQIDESALSRIEMIQDSFRLWAESPLYGHGIGSWPILQGVPYTIYYPHNIYMESLVELGVVGLILLFIITLTPFRNVFDDWNRQEITIVYLTTLTLLYAIIISLFSRDLATNRLLFIQLGILANCFVLHPRFRIRLRNP